jgi:hypothetical protein
MAGQSVRDLAIRISILCNQWRSIMTLKLHVAVGDGGKICGTIRVHGRDRDGHPMTFGLKPRPGQTVHAIDVDDDLMTHPVHVIHAKVAEILRLQRK